MNHAKTSHYRHYRDFFFSHSVDIIDPSCSRGLILGKMFLTVVNLGLKWTIICWLIKKSIMIYLIYQNNVETGRFMNALFKTDSPLSFLLFQNKVVIFKSLSFLNGQEWDRSHIVNEDLSPR